MIGGRFNLRSWYVFSRNLTQAYRWIGPCSMCGAPHRELVVTLFCSITNMTLSWRFAPGLNPYSCHVTVGKGQCRAPDICKYRYIAVFHMMHWGQVYRPCTDVTSNLLAIDVRIACDGLQRKFQHAKYFSCDINSYLISQFIFSQFSNIIIIFKFFYLSWIVQGLAIMLVFTKCPADMYKFNHHSAQFCI